MKVKIKGLVFVGFAAAILSANAMAADNTVTSKQYVDNKFQTIANLSQQGDLTGNQLDATSDTTYPSEKMVAAALTATGATVQSGTLTVNQNSQLVGTFSANQATNDPVTLNIAAPNWDATSSEQGYIDGKPSIVNAGTSIGSADGTATKELPTTYAVKQYVDTKATADLSGKQDKTGATSGYKVGNSDGTWADMGSAVTAATDGYVSVTGGTNGAAVAINIDNNKIDTTVTSGSSNLVTSDAVADAIANQASTDANTYQPKAEAGIKVGNDGAWDNLTASGYLTPDTSTTPGTVDIKMNSAKINNTGSAVANATSANDSLVTDYTLTGALNALPASNIPAMPTTGENACDATHPCALVTDANGAPVWKRIAQQGD